MKAQKILVPIDFSMGQERTLSLATSLARDAGAKLVIVHVMEPALAYAAGVAYYGAPNPREEMLRAVVPPASDVPCEHQSLTGVPAESIIEYAEEIDADIIVMGTHGRTGISRMLMGSVAEAVVRRAPCPVVTVKETVKETVDK